MHRIDLFEILYESYKRVFIKDNIWIKHCDNKITRVLRNWENKVKLIPPVLMLDGNKDKLLIQDGKHRFAVANYFNAVELPLIILRNVEARFLELAGDKAQKID